MRHMVLIALLAAAGLVFGCRSQRLGQFSAGAHSLPPPQRLQPRLVLSNGLPVALAPAGSRTMDIPKNWRPVAKSFLVGLHPDGSAVAATYLRGVRDSEQKLVAIKCFHDAVCQNPFRTLTADDDPAAELALMFIGDANEASVEYDADGDPVRFLILR